MSVPQFHNQNTLDQLEPNLLNIARMWGGKQSENRSRSRQSLYIFLLLFDRIEEKQFNFVSNNEEDMRKTALITGASKGIGKELARLLAKKGCNLVLVARSSEYLTRLKEELEDQYGVEVRVIVKDLCEADAPKEVFDEVKQAGIRIDYLINNAGFGDWGRFMDKPWERYKTMIELNTMALTYFMHLYVNEWKGKQGGKILNIASTAAFQPGPMMAVYFATKSYVLQLSEALNHELGEEGTSVTVLCPGPTSTYFGEESGMSASRLVKNVKIARASDVARLGYDAMMKGKPVAIHGAMNKIAPFAIRFFPRKWVTHLSARVMRLPKKR